MFKAFISIVLFLASASSLAQTKVDPLKINFPSGSTNCVYSPASNTCVGDVLYPSTGSDIPTLVTANCPGASQCTIHLMHGAYLWGSLVTRDNLTIEGDGEAQYPSSASDLTAFQTGTGSIIGGQVAIASNNVTLRNLSVDTGSSGGFCTTGAASIFIQPASGMGDTVTLQNVSTLLCATNGVHSILTNAKHIRLENITTRGGNDGVVAGYGQDIVWHGGNNSYHLTPFILKSTNFTSPNTTTSNADLSGIYIDHSGTPNIFANGVALSAVNLRGIQITNGAGLFINADKGSGGTGSGTISQINIDGYIANCNALGSNGLYISDTAETGKISGVFISHAQIDGCTNAGILMDSGVLNAHVANSSFTNFSLSTFPISSTAAMLYLDGGMQYGTAASPINNYAVFAGTGGTISICGNTSGFTNQTRGLVDPFSTGNIIGCTGQVQPFPLATAVTGCGSSVSTNVKDGEVVTGYFVAKQTSCAAALTFAPAPSGFVCQANDFTTPADTVKQTANATTGVTFSGTVVVNDTILFTCARF